MANPYSAGASRPFSKSFTRKASKMKLNPEQLYKVSRILENGTYGSFMSAIGCALQLADSDNKERLCEAFGDKFEQIYANAQEAERQSAQKLTEEQIEAYVERRIDKLDKKLMQGHITQQDYDREVGILDTWAIQQSKI